MLRPISPLTIDISRTVENLQLRLNNRNTSPVTHTEMYTELLIGLRWINSMLSGVLDSFNDQGVDGLVVNAHYLLDREVSLGVYLSTLAKSVISLEERIITIEERLASIDSRLTELESR